MAFIDNSEEDLQNQNPQNQGAGQSPLVGQGSSVVGSGATTGNPNAGTGPGGTGGWTNIQAYINANKSDTGSAQLVNSEVGTQFNQERQNFTNDSQKYLQDAQGQADKNKITYDEAGNLINQAASNYQYSGPGFEYTPTPSPGFEGQTPYQKVTPSAGVSAGQQADINAQQAANYQGIVDKFQHALNDKYSGPTSYNYGLSDKTQKYGSDLNDNSSFDTLMSNIYSRAGGAPLSGGQYELQKQLDVNNSALVGARKSLQDQYSQLTADRDKTVSDTTSGLSNIEQNYRENQSKLHDYLTGQANSHDTAEKQAEAAARSAYEDAYSGGKSGRSSIGYETLASNPDYWQNAINTRQGIDAWGNDLTWKQLQNEQNNRMYNWSWGQGPLWNNAEPEFDARKGDLDSFYNEQTGKYLDTGDQDKRAYNSILDFLGSQDPRREKNFNVRG